MIGAGTVTGLAGCASGNDTSQEQTQHSDSPSKGGGTTASTSSKAKTGLNEGQKPPDFSLQTTAGNKVTLRPVEKPTALFFMAAWCTSCKQEEDNLKQVYEKFGEDVRLISIDMDPDRDTMNDLQKFKKQYGGEWIHAMGTKELIQTYRLTSLDTTYIINQDGVTVYTDSDVTSVTQFKSKFKKLL